MTARSHLASPALAARLLELAREGRPRPAIALVLDLLEDGASLEPIVSDLLAPVQREAGLLWEANRWTTADEHAATAVIDGVLGALALEADPPQQRRGDVLVACVEGEFHTMPARMGVEVLRSDGWDVLFLGGGVPVDDLQRFTAERAPDVVAISCTMPAFLPAARRCFTAIAELGIPALGAGAAFGAGDDRALRLGASGRLLGGLDLADVLGAAEARERIVQPVSREALVLELDCEALRASCLAHLVERLPAMAAQPPRQDSRARSHVGLALAFLAAAVDLGEVEIFDDFVGWVRRVLDSRGVAPSTLDQALHFVSEVLAAAGLSEAARFCHTSAGAVARR
jgi:methanogenic corrinoid protein MtbC1